MKLGVVVNKSCWLRFRKLKNSKFRKGRVTNTLIRLGIRKLFYFVVECMYEYSLEESSMIFLKTLTAELLSYPSNEFLNNSTITFFYHYATVGILFQLLIQKIVISTVIRKNCH